ncbi:unnamed protein product [Arctia plantaginis]|uniref:Uncharacterized protein n=1 Tax=Arctia plantaginis TaxID=874455 RepID=A0A8S0Z210_ARCPL|nr:unnamed protein product [Arctia plantaginis]
MCQAKHGRGDLFGGLNDGLLSRAEALAAVDISKHQSGPQPGPPLPQLKHDMVYHHGVGGPSPHNARPHQGCLKSNYLYATQGCEFNVQRLSTAINIRNTSSVIHMLETLLY